MDWANVLALAVGVGIGLIVGRGVFRSRRQPSPEAGALDYQENAAPSLVTSGDPNLRSRLEAMNLAYQMALDMAQFKAGFLARTSHELRSPLNSVISLHQLILSDLCEDPAEERECIEQSMAAARRMLSVLDELVTVSKTESGRIALELQPVQLAYVFQQVRLLTHLIAQNSNLRLTVEEVDPNLYVMADPRRFQQVLVHLVDMAIAQMDEGFIRLSAQCKPELDQVYIRLLDDRPSTAWQEVMDMLYAVKDSQSAVTPPDHAAPIQQSVMDPGVTSRNSLPPGLSLLTAQTLIELMHGKLELMVGEPDVATADRSASPTSTDHSTNTTYLRCSVPLAPTPSPLDEAE